MCCVVCVCALRIVKGIVCVCVCVCVSVSVSAVWYGLHVVGVVYYVYVSSCELHLVGCMLRVGFRVV